MWHDTFLALKRDDDGQDLIEYSLMLAFVALVAVALLSGIETNIHSLWDSVDNALSDAVRVAG